MVSWHIFWKFLGVFFFLIAKVKTKTSSLLQFNFGAITSYRHSIHSIRYLSFSFKRCLINFSASPIDISNGESAVPSPHYWASFLIKLQFGVYPGFPQRKEPRSSPRPCLGPAY